MANFPISVINLPSGPIGVKSEFWLESTINDIDWSQLSNYAYLNYNVDVAPTLGSYFELKFNGQILRFTFIPPSIFNNQVTKTEYGYNIAVLHTLGSAESCHESLTSTLQSTSQLTQYYAIHSTVITARMPGEEWAFDFDHLSASPFISEYTFELQISESNIPPNIMVAMRIGFTPHKYDITGNPVPLLFSRPQTSSNGKSFYHRIDEVCLAQIPFELPEITGPAALGADLVHNLMGLIRIARFQTYQASNNPVVLQQGYSNSEDTFIVRSGISSESYKSLGNDWYQELVINHRAGILSYYDKRINPNWQKFIYLASMREGQNLRIFAKPKVLNSAGEVVQYNFFSLGVSNYVQESPFEILCFNLGGNFIEKLHERIATLLGITNYKLLGFSAVLAENSPASVFYDFGYIEVVPEIYGTYCIHYENDFGGLSDCWMMGGLSEFREIDKTEYQALGYNQTVANHQKFQKVNFNETTYEANSGAVDRERLSELLEMLHSQNVWITAKDGSLIPIVIDKSKASVGKDDFSGEYQFALNIKFSRAYNRQATAGEDIFSI